MQVEEYEVMYSEEKTYWWYVALQELVLRHAQNILRNAVRPRVLDAGCGTGRNLEFLRNAFPQAQYAGIDSNPIAVKLSRDKGFADVYQAFVENMPFESGTFDLIVSLDVLYFKGLDDQKAMNEFNRVLKPGGFLITNLPAFNCLKGRHDLAVSGCRRYTKRDVQSLAIISGFRIQAATYWNMFLFPILMIWRPLSYLLAAGSTSAVKSDLKRLPHLLNKILTRIVLSEIRLSGHFSLPYGSSIFTVAQKL